LNHYLLILIVAAGLVYSSAAAAQIVLRPSSFGTVTKRPGAYKRVNVQDSVIKAGKSRNVSYYDTCGYTSTVYSVQGVLEFNLDDPELPVSLITENNFSAKMYNLHGVPFDTSAWTYIALLDLGDDSEDDRISKEDFDSIEGDDAGIAQRSFSIEGSCASFSRVDVTYALRRDLFGRGSKQSTSGFILISLDHADSLRGIYSPPGKTSDTTYTTIAQRMKEPVLFFAGTQNDSFGHMPFLLVEIDGYDAGHNDIDIVKNPCEITGEYERYKEAVGEDIDEDDDGGNGCSYLPSFTGPAYILLMKFTGVLFSVREQGKNNLSHLGLKSRAMKPCGTEQPMYNWY